MNKSEESRLDALEKGMKALTASMAEVLKLVGRQATVQALRAEDEGAITAGHSRRYPTGIAASVTADLYQEVAEASVGRLSFQSDPESQAQLDQAVGRMKDRVALDYEDNLKNVSETSQQIQPSCGVLTDQQAGQSTGH